MGGRWIATTFSQPRSVSISGDRPTPWTKPPYVTTLPSLVPYVGRLGSGPHIVGRIGSGVPVSASFQKIPAGSCPMPAKGGLWPKGSFVQGLWPKGGGCCDLGEVFPGGGGWVRSVCGRGVQAWIMLTDGRPYSLTPMRAAIFAIPSVSMWWSKTNGGKTSPERCRSAATSRTQPPTPSTRTTSDSVLRSLRKRRLLCEYPSIMSASWGSELTWDSDAFVSRHVLRSNVAVYPPHTHTSRVYILFWGHRVTVTVWLSNISHAQPFIFHSIVFFLNFHVLNIANYASKPSRDIFDGT